MTCRNCNLLLLLLVASVAAYIPSANGATALFIPSAASQTTKSRKRKNKDAVSAARSMNSIAFLSELVALKDTSDVRYFQSNEQAEQEAAVPSISRGGGGIACQKQKTRHRLLRRIVNAARSGTVQLSAAASHNDVDINGRKTDCNKSPEVNIAASFSKSTTTEYTGNLWFMRNKGIRFRETVRVSDISRDGKTATVECITKYRTKGRWHDCSKVTCTLSAANRGINMVTDSEVLVRLPLPGLAGKAVRSKISLAFESAAQAFFGVGEETGEPESDSLVHAKPTRGVLFYAY